jgi:hypothetical protein
MPKPIAFNTGTKKTGSLKQGNVELGNLTNVDYGANYGGLTWYNSLDADTGYVIMTDTYTMGLTTFSNSKPVIWKTPDFTDNSVLTTINGLPNRVGQTRFTGTTEAFAWSSSSGAFFNLSGNMPNIITDNLILFLDASNVSSYPKTGTLWYDLSGNGNHGTLINGPTFDSAANSINLDGVDDYIRVPNNGGFSIGTGNFTICVWVYVPVVSNWNYIHLFSFDNQSMWAFKATDKSYSTVSGSPIYFYGGSEQYRSSSDSFGSWNLKGGYWQYVCISRNGSSHKAYYNGSYVGEYTNDPKSISCTNVNIGWGWGSEYTEQKRGQIQFYNRTITNSEILQNYYESIPITKNGLVFNLDAGNPLSYVSGTTIWNDRSGNNYNGVLNNGPTFNSENGGYITFDGTNDYFEVQQRAPLTEFQYYDSFSIEIWVGNPINQYLFTNRKNTSLQYSGWAIYGQGNTIQCWVGGYPNQYGWRRIYAPINAGGWNHIVYTNSSDYLSQKVYVNGVDVGYDVSRDNGWEQAIIDYNQTPYHVPVIGTSPADGYSQFGGGKIPIARVYNRTLTANEALQNFNALKIRFGL